MNSFDSFLSIIVLRIESRYTAYAESFFLVPQWARWYRVIQDSTCRCSCGIACFERIEEKQLAALHAAFQMRYKFLNYHGSMIAMTFDLFYCHVKGTVRLKQGCISHFTNLGIHHRGYWYKQAFLRQTHDFVRHFHDITSSILAR
jgi:hypothetical protein